ncbi:MAG TPA: hypothetical protein VMT31_00820 [Methanomicrobiales archaeon]|nr:hypothetical protein [Methanomicrobiales archaeon]
MRSNRIGPIMQCPVCGKDCVQKAEDLVATLETVFAPCGECRGGILDKTRPPADLTVVKPCPCGKRFIDDVFVHLYGIMLEEGALTKEDPLKRVGMPLVHPGFAMEGAPYLPNNSLLLLSMVVDEPVAKRLYKEVPELRGVVKCGSFVPGAIDVDLAVSPRVYQLLAGCDVRADVFYTQHNPVVVYKQQSLIHIEFPRGYDPKIVNVGVRIRHSLPRAFVDASCGVGTLGIIAAQYGVPHVIMNDAWYAAAFWAAYNLKVNSATLLAGEIHILEEYGAMATHPVVREPRRIAYSEGKQLIEVYQGDFRNLPPLIPEKNGVLSIIDLFEKGDEELNRRILEDWRARVGGEVFIP